MKITLKLILVWDIHVVLILSQGPDENFLVRVGDDTRAHGESIIFNFKNAPNGRFPNWRIPLGLKMSGIYSGMRLYTYLHADHKGPFILKYSLCTLKPWEWLSILYLLHIR